MVEPRWIQIEAARVAHDIQLAVHGGLAGVRDQRLLESAMVRPQNLLAYGSPPPDLAALAAAYVFGIVRNHPFVDGNKRTAWSVGRAFLLLNRMKIDASQDEKADAVIALAAIEMDEAEFAAWIRERLRPCEA